MRTSLLSLLVFFVLGAPAADAQVTPYAGYNTQHETVLVGAAYRVPFGPTVVLVPSVETAVGGGENYFQASGDLTLNLAHQTQFVPYVGAGVTAGRIPMDGVTKWRTGGNGLVGVRFAWFSGFVPFAQLRYTNVVGGDAVSVMGGATLRL